MSACSSFDNFKGFLEARFKAHVSEDGNGSDTQANKEALKVAQLVAERLIPGEKIIGFEGREDGCFTLEFERAILGKIEYLNPEDAVHLTLLHGRQVKVAKKVRGRVEPEKGRIAFDSRCIMHETGSRLKPNPSFVAAGFTQKKGYTVTGSLVLEKEQDVSFDMLENSFVRWINKS